MPDHLAPVSARKRFLWALVAWLGIAAAQPGLIRPQGFGHMTFIALVPWALVCCRPGRRAFLCEWLAAAIGLLLLMVWMRHLFAWLVPILALVPALYHALSGFALRRMAQRYPLALAAPAAFLLGELLRWAMPPPLSFAWWRLGSFLHDTEWVAGSARVWGAWGLTWIGAAFAGWVADLWRTRKLMPCSTPPFPPWLVHTLGVGPLALGIGFTVIVPAPKTEPGPRLLLVQPGIDQELKRQAVAPLERWADMVRGTHAGLEAADGPVDLVCWGETMFPYRLVTEQARRALAEGANSPAYTGRRIEAAHLDQAQDMVDFLVGAFLFDGASRMSSVQRRFLVDEVGLPESIWGASGLLGDAAFLTGIQEVIVEGGDLRHRNAAALWVDGALAGTAAKVHLVPAAEDPGIWVHFPFLTELMGRVGGFVPDFVSAEEVELLDLPFPSGPGAWSIGTSICYDQIFDDPYAGRAGEVDLHLVLSNEAWYGDSAEMDHMVAFARLDAIATGRSVVRATNSGVSCVIDPSGALLGVIESPQGRRKMVRGSLAIQVPVPLERARTPWVMTYRWQPWLWAAFCLGLLLCARVTGAGQGGTRQEERESGVPYEA